MITVKRFYVVLFHPLLLYNKLLNEKKNRRLKEAFQCVELHSIEVFCCPYVCL